MNKIKYRFLKRVVDILAAGFLLLLFSPIFILVALLIKIESRGPVFYTSKRVGEGFRIFDFYKFRSMRTGADKQLASMSSANQYGQVEPSKIFKNTVADLEYVDGLLVKDGGFIDPKAWQFNLDGEKAAVYVKFKGDPRITRVGRLIRNSSLDELPQLWNVLKGDMSIVGNRPLPLYEAQNLTCDASIGRFNGPAGITGLWQVTERGKAEASALSRQNLDVRYAEECSPWLDFKILLKTPVAAFQTADV